MLHRVEWTDKKVGEFWANIDRLIEKKERVNDYFSNGAGDEFLKCVTQKVEFSNKKILDYGCGIGILAEKILDEYNPELVCGCDISKESVTMMDERCKKYKNYGGAYEVNEAMQQFGKGKFDIVIAMEIVEHLSDQDLDIMLKRARSFLKKGGILLVSTPNDENLKESIVVCPDCGCYFHKVQHVRSWNKKSLSVYLERYGFRTKKMIITDLAKPKGWLRRLYADYTVLRKKVFGRDLNNLIYIGCKM